MKKLFVLLFTISVFSSCNTSERKCELLDSNGRKPTGIFYLVKEVPNKTEKGSIIQAIKVKDRKENYPYVFVSSEGTNFFQVAE